MNPSLLRLISIGKIGGRFSGVLTVIATPLYYMSKSFHNYWLKDDKAKNKKRDYVCTPNTRKRNK